MYTCNPETLGAQNASDVLLRISARIAEAHEQESRSIEDRLGSRYLAVLDSPTFTEAPLRCARLAVPEGAKPFRGVIGAMIYIADCEYHMWTEQSDIAGLSIVPEISSAVVETITATTKALYVVSLNEILSPKQPTFLDYKNERLTLSSGFSGGHRLVGKQILRGLGEIVQSFKLDDVRIPLQNT